MMKIIELLFCHRYLPFLAIFRTFARIKRIFIMKAQAKPNFLTDLQARGIIQDIMQGTEAQLTRERTNAYVGVDATASSLHIGNLATYMVLKHFQRAGHRPYIILGGGTSLIGDPTFRTKGRSEISVEELRYNQQCIEKQINKLFGVGEGSDAVVLNNYDWLSKISFLDFLRDVGKYVTINYMTSKESVKTRMETGMSYTEFAYQLLQGYDFYHLYTQHDVKMQLGGADQWGNITTGAELIRKKAGATAFGMTTPLITRADGSKFGKSADGENVWLDPEMTSPYQFYQFWLNRGDEEAKTCIYRMTMHPIEQLRVWEAEHTQAPHQRLLQKELAKSLTIFIHGEEAYQQAFEATTLLFGNQPITQEGSHLSEATLLEALAGVPRINISQGDLTATQDILELLTTTTQGAIFNSKRAAREMISAGAVRINKVKMREATQSLTTLPTWMDGRYFLVQKGKKNYYLICCENA